MKVIQGLFLLLVSLQVVALELPVFNSHVLDNAGILSSSNTRELKEELKRVYEQGGPQIFIYTIPSLGDESIEEYSIKVANHNKIGDEKLDNGVLILVAKSERLIRIEVGSGVEGDLTDVETNRIIEDMIPYFKDSEYDKGINLAVSGVLSKLNNPIEVKVKNPKKDGSTLGAIFFWGFVIYIGVIIFLFSIGQRRLAIDLIELGFVLFGRSGRGSSSSSRGGGGGFSGGGSSGRW